MNGKKKKKKGIQIETEGGMALKWYQNYTYYVSCLQR